jgi:uncharacterized protein YgbK (DUF1537 family)
VIHESELLAGARAEVPIPASEIAAIVDRSQRVLIVLDDDPTGTQSVHDLPVLTRWDESDFRWAFTPRPGHRRAAAVYVLTNTRSLSPDDAATRNRDIVTNAVAAADASGITLGFVSRGDSTLRGHYPLEPDVIAATLRAVAALPTDGVVLVPAFPDAGRITIGGVHFVRGEHGSLIPVADTEFAADASFGFANSALAAWVEEKSEGRYPAAGVIVLDLDVVRGGSTGIADAVASAHDSTPIVADTVTENDLRALALGLAEAESRGKRLIYRVGPPFVRARIGQEQRAPLTAAEVFSGQAAAPGGGLIVVGSHVGVTTRQLGMLTRQHRSATVVEIQVASLVDDTLAEAHVTATVEAVVTALADGDVILHTSRLLVRSDDADSSLLVARTVSAAVVAVVRRVLAVRPPRFVIAKGGITSSDVAAHGLEIRHAIVRGPMLPGIVSLWEPVDGPAAGIPYVVFAGNVGDDGSLLKVVQTLSSTF